MKTKISISFILLAALSLSPRSEAATEYQLTDLGFFLRPWTLNEKTEVTGSTEGFPYTNFLWKQGAVSYQSVPTTSAVVSFAYDINENGRVVGLYNDCYWIAGCQDQAIYWENGTATVLGTGKLHGVNDSNQMVGEKPVGDSYIYRATQWQADGTSQDLGTLGGQQSFAMKINNAGQVIGTSEVSSIDSTQHAVLWNNGNIMDLGTFGGANSIGLDINNNGYAVGLAETANNEVHTFFWNGTEKIDINPSVSSVGYGLNDLGQIVGSMNNYQNAFIWENGIFTNLQDLVANNSGWTLNQAFDINNNGQIVGIGMLNGGARGYLLTPVVTPEPSSMILFGVGGIAMALRRFRKRKL